VENQVDYVRAAMPTARGLEPEQDIAVFSPESDRDWAGNVFQERRPEFRVNYGHDWVEGNYEAGHTIWITVTEGYDGPIKATAELATGVVPWWGGRTGFSTNWQGWSPDQPDIVPGDWVYGRVDDGFDWDFGDGSPVVTTTSSATTHTYPTQGAYLAMLTVWDDAGNSATRDTGVNIDAPEYLPPVADPGGPYSGRIGQEIVLDGSGSYDPDGGMDDGVVLYEWDVADGRLYTTTESTLAYTWTVSGTFVITLRVQDRGVDDGFDLPKWSEPATTTVTISEEVSASPDGKEIDWLVVATVAASLTIIAAVLSVAYRRGSR